MVIFFISTISSCNWGGSEGLWSETAKQAIADGHKVIIYVPFEKYINKHLIELQSLGARMIIIDINKKFSLINKIINKIIRIKAGYPNIPHYYFLLWKAVRKFNPDFISISQGGAFDVIYHPEVRWLIEECKIPYFLTGSFNREQFTYPYSEILLIRKAVLNARKTFFISHRNAYIAKRQLASHDFNNSEIVKYPVRFRCEKPLKMPDNKIIKFAFIGRIHCNTKGLDILFEILSLPKWKERNWIFNLYGEGEDKNYLLDLAEYYGINDKIKFLGYESDIVKIWSDNHLLLLPSIAEGTPAVIVEAMLCGRIAVATDVGDNSYLINDNVNGFIAPASSIKFFEEALDRAWQNMNNWEEFGKNAFEFINKYVEDNPAKTLLNKMINYL